MNAPQRVGTASTWASVSAGDYTTCARRTDGTVWCWGLGSDGQLGTGSGQSSTPSQVGTDTDWVQITTGAYHTCARKTGGTLWCWGANWSSQIGDGTTTNRWSPVQVGSATDWVDVEASGYTTCGRRSGGSLWCWGANWWGNIGDGTTSDNATPVQIGAGSTWTRLGKGMGGFTCALRSDATLWCWGHGGMGEFGDGTQPYQSTTPRQVQSGVASFALGWAHLCTVGTDTRMRCNGTNDELQTGWEASITTPAQVTGGAAWKP
jgi:alpha-tubulin suppressor-like RCC1 family protein